MKKAISANSFANTLLNSIFPLQQLDVRTAILFEIKVFYKKIKDSTLASYFIKRK